MIQDIILKIERLSDKLYRTIIAIIKNHDDALDLVQETFIKIYHKDSDSKEPVKDSYVIKTGYNLALNSKRNSTARTTIEQNLSLNTTEVVDNDPLSLLEMKENRDRMLEAIMQLSERQREIITYRFISDMKIPEIAELLAISEGSVKVHLARGLQKMKKLLLTTERN